MKSICVPSYFQHHFLFSFPFLCLMYVCRLASFLDTWKNVMSNLPVCRICLQSFLSCSWGFWRGDSSPPGTGPVVWSWNRTSTRQKQDKSQLFTGGQWHVPPKKGGGLIAGGIVQLCIWECVEGLKGTISWNFWSFFSSTNSFSWSL